MNIVFNGENDEYDMSLSLLINSFNMLVDYVEVEKAISYAIVNDKKEFLPTWNPFSKYFKLWYRDKELGLMRLEEETGIELETDILVGGEANTIKSKQAETAFKVIELYKWWKDRTHRLKDFMERTPKDEDQEMLQKLINIRMELFS